VASFAVCPPGVSANATWTKPGAPGLLFTNKPGFYRRPQICRLPIVILNGTVEIGAGGGKEIQAHHSADLKPRSAPTPVLEGPTLDEFRTLLLLLACLI
jgi:hypothetical protein